MKRKVRHAKPSDLRYVDSLQRHWREHVGWIPLRTLKRYILQHQQLIVLENNEPAGYLNWCANRKGMITVPQVAIDEQLLRTTIGTDILQHLIDAAIEHGCSAIRLSSAENIPANHFWPTLGFTRTAILKPKNNRKRLINEFTLQLDPKTLLDLQSFRNLTPLAEVPSPLETKTQLSLF